MVALFSMYRNSRQLHKWTGICIAIFLLLISGTGFFLATKDRFDWMRPPEADAVKVESAAELVSVEAAVNSAFALGHPELQSFKDIDRVDYRPKSNIYKVISRDGYREVQVDGKTAQVLSSSFRNDQFMEDLHDFTFFAELAHAWLLPLVAIGLFGLALSGIIIFMTPVYRRWQFKRRVK